MSPFRQMDIAMLDRERPDPVSRGLRPVGETSQDGSKAQVLLNRHQATGGCYTVQALAVALNCSARRAAALLDRWMSSRCVLLMPMETQALLPVYQLDLVKGAPRPEIQTVVAELADVFSDAEFAEMVRNAKSVGTWLWAEVSVGESRARSRNQERNGGMCGIQSASCRSMRTPLRVSGQVAGVRR